MTLLELFKKSDPSVLAAKMIFKHLQDLYPVFKISDIADTSSGGTPNRGMIEYYNGDIPWVKSGELKDGLITACDEYITEAGLKNSSAKLFPKGTLLVAMYGANIGKTGVLDFDATTNQAICAIFPKVEISMDFLFWYFKQQRLDFIAIGKGGAQPNISQTVINDASIVVPNAKTQKLIVEFLERIERGDGIDGKFFIREVLEDVERICKFKKFYIDLTTCFENQLSQIESLNQAILQEAVQGKLVSQDPTDEPASKLLKRIKAEKATLRQAQGPKKENPLPPIKPEEIPFKIPEGWVWCRLGEITCLITSGSRDWAQYYSSNGAIFVRMGNLSQDSFNLRMSTIQYVNPPKNQEGNRTRLEEGDILISITGEVGNLGLIPSNFGEAYINQHTGLVRLQKIIPSKFISYLFLSEPMQDQFKAPQRGMKNSFRLSDIEYLLIPLPPLSEQARIVAEIEKQLVLTKQLKEHVIANQQATEQLLKALLHGAFEVDEVS
ncbi:MAG: restriction endonuclease subunit S [Mariniphaga sp.]